MYFYKPNGKIDYQNLNLVVSFMEIVTTHAFNVHCCFFQLSAC